MNDRENERLTTLYRELQPKMLSYALGVLKDPDYAQDVVQDTFYEAARYVSRLLEHPNPEGWLMQALKFKLMESQRARNRYLLRFLSLESDDDRMGAIGEMDTPETVYLRMRGVMDTIRSALSPEDFDLLRRIVLERDSHKEAARALGISIAASQKRLSRIRKQLRPLFPERRRRGMQGILARFRWSWEWGR